MAARTVQAQPTPRRWNMLGAKSGKAAPGRASDVQGRGQRATSVLCSPCPSKSPRREGTYRRRSSGRRCSRAPMPRSARSSRAGTFEPIAARKTGVQRFGRGRRGVRNSSAQRSRRWRDLGGRPTASARSCSGHRDQSLASDGRKGGSQNVPVHTLVLTCPAQPQERDDDEGPSRCSGRQALLGRVSPVALDGSQIQSLIPESDGNWTQGKS